MTDKKRTRREKRKIIVIGNGMVSYKFCEKLADKIEHRQNWQITVFGEEPRVAYCIDTYPVKVEDGWVFIELPKDASKIAAVGLAKTFC